MCPGLTSPGAKMTNKPKGTVVVISIDKINKQNPSSVTDSEFAWTGNYGRGKAACSCSRDNCDVY